MATLGSSMPPPSPSFTKRRRSLARRLERYCCCCFAFTLAFFPLFFVYGLGAWAVFVAVQTSLFDMAGTYAGPLGALLAFVMWLLAMWSYTVAVFTSPGSPLDPISSTTTKTRKRGRGGAYVGLPTTEERGNSIDADTEAEAGRGAIGFVSLTAKSDGKTRFCKKCKVHKPDRAHHCSTCNRCVLKMDHHCPWLATCVGLRNYKAFLLFLTYISLFCCVAFAISATWVYGDIFNTVNIDESLHIVNVIMLAVLSGIIGLVLSGFGAWHYYLAARGQTTIESLEKTRYLSPLKRSMQQQMHHSRHYIGDQHNPDDPPTLGEQLKEMHANSLPGITRPEEGLSHSASSSSMSANTPESFDNSRSSSSPAQSALRRNWAQMERDREHDRYAAYLDELDSEKLPFAFNLGWRRNLRTLFGEEWYFWFLPICNTQGDGWHWEVSEEWTRKRDEVARARKQRDEDEQRRMKAAGWGHDDFDFAAERTQHGYHANPVAAVGAGRHYQQPQQPPPWQNSPTPWTPSWADPASSDADGENVDYDSDADEESSDMDNAVGGTSRSRRPDGRYITTTNGVAHVPHRGRRNPNKADMLLGRSGGTYNDVPPGGHLAAANSLSPGGPSHSNNSSRSRSRNEEINGTGGVTRGAGDWNDIPEDMLAARNTRGTRQKEQRDRNNNNNNGNGRAKGD